MEKGRASPAVTAALTALYAAVLKIHAGADDRVVYAEIMRELDQLSEARRARIVAATGTVPRGRLDGAARRRRADAWLHLLLRHPNLRAQTLMTGILSLLIFSGLLTVVAIDHPFAGSVKVGPEPLVFVLKDFGAR